MTKAYAKELGVSQLYDEVKKQHLRNWCLIKETAILIGFLAGLLLGRQFGGRVEEVDPKPIFSHGRDPQLEPS
ncbi:MAG: hypothetical protein QXQ91_03925 [Nanopusillaceae archaeon]